MWLGALKLAVNAGTHIFKKRQETKMRMADAQAAHVLLVHLPYAFLSLDAS